MAPCRSCRQPLDLLLDFGPQPLCNRLLPEPAAVELRHPLRLGQCPACGLLQLDEPVAAAVLKPPRPVVYNEPEWHLDQVAPRIAALPGVTRDADICGLTYKETSLIARLRQCGYRNAVCLDIRRDLGIREATAGIETVQERISAGVLSDLAEHRGRYQVVIARHLLEHAHDLPAFVAGLRGVGAANGYLIFEVPDFAVSLRGGDYSTLWEEHVVYFTKATFAAVLVRLGLQVHTVFEYPSGAEGLLVGVTQQPVEEKGLAPSCVGETQGTPPPRGACPPFSTGSQAAERAGGGSVEAGVVQAELTQGRHYAAHLPAARQAWLRACAAERTAGRQVALLGAGHLAIMFVNLLDLRGVIDFVIDDDPAKCGSYLPGSHLPVCPSEALYARPVGLCLMSVAPESERRVRERHRRFLESGGRLVSIFPGSDIGLP